MARVADSSLVNSLLRRELLLRFLELLSLLDARIAHALSALGSESFVGEDGTRDGALPGGGVVIEDHAVGQVKLS